MLVTLESNDVWRAARLKSGCIDKIERKRLALVDQLPDTTLKTTCPPRRP